MGVDPFPGLDAGDGQADGLTVLDHRMAGGDFIQGDLVIAGDVGLVAVSLLFQKSLVRLNFVKYFVRNWCLIYTELNGASSALTANRALRG